MCVCVCVYVCVSLCVCVCVCVCVFSSIFLLCTHMHEHAYNVCIRVTHIHPYTLMDTKDRPMRYLILLLALAILAAIFCVNSLVACCTITSPVEQKLRLSY